MWKIHLRSSHRCGSRCHAGHHSYLANDQHERFTSSETYAAAPVTPAAREAVTTTLGSNGDAVDKGFAHGDDEGYFRGDHYCRISFGRKGVTPPEPLEVGVEGRGA